MKYRLGWLEHWSTKRESIDPRVITLFNEESDGWYEHERLLYFIESSDKKAIAFVKKYIEDSDTIEVFSLSRDDKVIFTEENL